MQDCLLLLVAFALMPTTREMKMAVAFLAIAILPFPYIALYAGPPYSALFDLLPLSALGAAAVGYSRQKALVCAAPAESM
jgi:hypothetical protein